MKLKRLDSTLVKLLKQSNKYIRNAISSGQVQVNGTVEKNRVRTVTPFCTLAMNNQIVQEKHAYYIMLHKPKAYLSATKDNMHRCVVECIQESFVDELHLVGRLDYFTTGLLLLTNDGHWSGNISNPLKGKKVPKRYLVTTLTAIDSFEEAASQFQKGLYLPDNDLTCRPALLERYVEENREAPAKGKSGSTATGKKRKRANAVGERTDELTVAVGTTQKEDDEGETVVAIAVQPPVQHRYWITLYEGKRHQVKCMINAISNGTNRVTELHRRSIGKLVLHTKRDMVGGGGGINHGKSALKNDGSSNSSSSSSSSSNGDGVGVGRDGNQLKIVPLESGQWRHLTLKEVNLFETSISKSGDKNGT